MALNIGKLYAQLTGQAAGFSKAMATGTKDLERFAREAKRVSAEVAAASAVFAGMGAAAVRLASSVDGPTKAAMTGLENSTKLLAVQVSDVLLPAVRELSGIVKRAAGVVAGLDPEVKKQISNFAVLAVQLAVAAKAFSIFSGLAANVFGVLKAGFGMVAAIGVGPLLNIIAAVGLVIAAVLLLHRAWRKNWGGIQEATQDVLKWFRDAFSQLGTFFGKFWGFLVDGAARFVESILSAIDVLQKLTGSNLVNTGGLREGFAGMFQDLKSGAFFSEAFTFGKTIGQQLVDGVAEEWKALRSELGFDKLGLKTGAPIALGRGMGAGPHVGSVDTSSVGTMAWLGGMQAAGASAEEAMNGIAENFSAAQGAAVEAEMAAQAQADAAEKAAADAKASAQRWAAVGRIALAGFTRALGEVGTLINAAVEGAQAGGPVGAVVAVIMEVLQKTASAMEFVGIAMEFVKRIAAMIEPLVKPIFDALTNVLGIVAEIVEPIFAALVPLFESIGGFVKQLSPILYAVGDILQGLAPILEVIGKVVGVIFQALKPIIDLIAGILKVVATVILGVIIALNEIAAAFGDEKAKAESARLKGIVDRMWSPSANDLAIANGEAAGATLRNAAAQDEAAKTAKKVSESLSNVPTGYRLAHARYQADLGITAGNGYIGGGGGSSGTTIIINGDITTDADSIEAIADDAREAAKERARERGQRTGNPTNRSGSGGRNG